MDVLLKLDMKISNLLQIWIITVHILMGLLGVEKALHARKN